ncbi:MAG: hypothetical protein WCC00_10570 [Candidatus Aminicenantales bacterium]
MTITRHRTPVKPKPKGNAPLRLFRSVFLWAGVSALVIFAVLVAVSWDPGLADFIFWLIAIWMVFIRYVEIGHVGKEPQHIHPKAVREWRLYSVKLLLAAGFLYALARIVAARPPGG